MRENQLLVFYNVALWESYLLLRPYKWKWDFIKIDSNELFYCSNAKTSATKWKYAKIMWFMQYSTLQRHIQGFLIEVN